MVPVSKHLGGEVLADFPGFGSHATRQRAVLELGFPRHWLARYLRVTVVRFAAACSCR